MNNYFGVPGKAGHRYRVGTEWFGRRVVDLPESVGGQFARVAYTYSGVERRSDLRIFHAWVLKQERRGRDADDQVVGVQAQWQALVADLKELVARHRQTANTVGIREPAEGLRIDMCADQLADIIARHAPDA